MKTTFSQRCSAVRRLAIVLGLAATTLTPISQSAQAQITATGVDPVLARTEGVGPYKRLVLRNAIMIDGTGAPAQGPVDIVISGDRIAEIKSIGAPKAIVESQRAAKGDYEIDLTGYYVMPGFIDTHVHLHSLEDDQKVPTNYILKLWMAHGVTTVREVGNNHPMEWSVDIKRRSAANEILAPRFDVYPMFQAIRRGALVNTAADARATIQEAKKRGADGIKFIGGAEDVLMAAIEEADKLDLRTTMHHAQPSVAYANVLTTSEVGLESMEHWYGLPEAMFADRQFQKWPNDFINNDEQMRFAESGRLWQQAAKPGSDKWNQVMDTLLERNFALSPTFTAYLTSRDFMRMSRAQWHEQYSMPGIWDYYKPSRHNHGSYWFDWTTEDEMDWKENYRLWMQFVNEYKNRGGLVSVGSDSGYIYNLYGFGYVQEMELLREAGFTPLEVIHAATQVGAKVLGHEDEIGTIRVGRKADFAIVKGNPLANMKLLYGTGTLNLNDETGKVERVGGITYTIKDGIVYDARQIRAEIRDMVAKAKAERGLPNGIMTIEDADLTGQ
ncbi:putative hydrolase [Sphingobium sp. SYK-6]|uniref:amidohydrolase family protein n=1 Tax=Sphingobium sp. (strain NBRC 103272 / SYK-6) TaxID=627192 RepID=UPI0002277334|nr:amidohydrolase family protein [Sphingobium sp. SYK-6]BAK66499.1 putative hydrolase [Sphingobium sp. SYK-6]